jgi:hypothetical protein
MEATMTDLHAVPNGLEVFEKETTDPPVADSSHLLLARMAKSGKARDAQKKSKR